MCWLRSMTHLQKKCPVSGGEAPVLELGGLWNTSVLPLLSDPLRSVALIPGMILSMAQKDPFEKYVY